MAGEVVRPGLFKVGGGPGWFELRSGLNLAGATDVEVRIVRPRDPMAIVKTRAAETVKLIGTADTDWVPEDESVDCLVWIEQADLDRPETYRVEPHDVTGGKDFPGRVGTFYVEPTLVPTT